MTSEPDKAPVSRVQILEMLQNGIASEGVTKQVQERGIDFEPSDEYLEVYQIAGAQPVLRAAVCGTHGRRLCPSNPARVIENMAE